MASKIAVVDNFDSFVYVLVQYLGELGAEIEVLRNDCDLEEITAMQPDGLLISPGPGTPADAGLSNEAIKHFAGKVPIFGVCLGHQCIAELYGATVSKAPELMHGKTSAVHHKGEGVFAGIASPVTATRYHSLAIENTSMTDQLEVTAETDDGIIMGIRHKELDIEGVQFHPESVLTEHGHEMLQNFLNRAR